MTGKKPDNTDNLKPAFDKCFRFEGVRCETREDKVKVSVCLYVLMRVDEEYEITVSGNWGKRGTSVNPSHFSYNKTVTLDFIFSKRANRKIGKIIVCADGKELSNKFHSSDSNEIEIKVGNVFFTLVRVEHGSFMMGVIPNESMNFYHDELPLHEVVLTKDYYIGKNPVTRTLWKTVMGDDPTKDYIEGDPTRQPVNTVSWNDCQLFIDRLNTNTGMQFRLPTEAEWEFAAKGGIKSMGYLYSGSDNIDEVASYEDETAYWPMMHKYTRPNELGIYDMSGTVWEWCQDWYAEYVGDRQTDQTGPENGTERFVRGGSWGRRGCSPYGDENFFGTGKDCCRSSYRNRYSPDKSYYDFGLRLVLSE